MIVYSIYVCIHHTLSHDAHFRLSNQFHPRNNSRYFLYFYYFVFFFCSVLFSVVCAFKYNIEMISRFLYSLTRTTIHTHTYYPITLQTDRIIRTRLDALLLSYSILDYIFSLTRKTYTITNSIGLKSHITELQYPCYGLLHSQFHIR